MFLIPHNGLENNFKIFQCFCGPIQVHIPNGTLISSAVLAELMGCDQQTHATSLQLSTNHQSMYEISISSCSINGNFVAIIYTNDFCFNINPDKRLTEKLTKLLNGTVGTPRQLQRDVHPPPLVEYSSIGVQWYSWTCCFRYYSNQLRHASYSLRTLYTSSTHNKYIPALLSWVAQQPSG